MGSEKCGLGVSPSRAPFQDNGEWVNYLGTSDLMDDFPLRQMYHPPKPIPYPLFPIPYSHSPIPSKLDVEVYTGEIADGMHSIGKIDQY